MRPIQGRVNCFFLCSDHVKDTSPGVVVDTALRNALLSSSFGAGILCASHWRQLLRRAQEMGNVRTAVEWSWGWVSVGRQGQDILCSRVEWSAKVEGVKHKTKDLE